MSIRNVVLASALYLIPLCALGYDNYDYTPMEDDESYYSYDRGNSDYYNDDNEDAYAYRGGDSRKSSREAYSSRRASYSGAGKTFVFDPRGLRWYAYANGRLINEGRASGGRHYCPDIKRGCRTPVGVFRVSSKGGSDCKSSKYPIGKGNAPMPWCMFFRGGYAIHGSYDVPRYNASHGCIRVHPEDARWLNHNFMSSGTRVIVKSY